MPHTPAPTPAASSFSRLPNECRLRIGALASTPAKAGLLPVSKTTLWRWVKEDKFPRPQRLSAGVTVWKVGDIRAWLAQQEAANQQPQAQ